MELFIVYSLFPIAITQGQGFTVMDDKGQQYLDFYGGHAVISIGHSHPTYVRRIQEQVARLGFYSNSVVNPLQEQLASRLGQLSGCGDYRLFLVNSGAEANENALKLASFVTGRSKVLAVEKSFHGRTSLAVEATDNLRIQAPINCNGHVLHLPLNEIAPWEEALSKGDVAAVIIECVQGIGGCRVAEAEWAQQLQQLCRKYGTMFVADEVQCGYGRTGRFFAHQWLNLQPDLITVGKGIANGFPMAGLLVAPHIAAVRGQLGTTFGGSHLACAAALAVLDVMEQEQLVEQAHRVGNYLMEALKQLSERAPHLLEIRGRGLMVGVDLDVPHSVVREPLIFSEYCFTGCSGTHTLRLLPPLCITEAAVDDFMQRLERVLLSV